MRFINNDHTHTSARLSAQSLSFIAHFLISAMSLLAPTYKKGGNQSGKNKGKGKGKENRVYSVSKGEYSPTRCLSMYPDKTTGASTKAPADGFSLFEDMAGSEIIALHGAMNRRGDTKCVEELQKVAIGLSENAASLVALLDALRQQASSTIPVFNVPLFQRRIKKLTDAEHALQILDLARDLPSSDTDVRSAVTAWLNLGTELAKPHFQALLVAASKFIPALTNGICRCHLVSAFAAFPADTMNAVTEPGLYPPAALTVSKGDPTLHGAAA